MKKFEVSNIPNLIYNFRGYKVMLDSDLATLYGVETKVLNQSVSRNLERFPKDFAFRLNRKEWENLKSQIVTSSGGHGGRRKHPYMFTEQGISMLSSVLKSKKAIDINIQIMRTFVNMRNLAVSYRELEKKILKVEEQSDQNYKLLLKALFELKSQIEPSLTKHRKKIGFK